MPLSTEPTDPAPPMAPSAFPVAPSRRTDLADAVSLAKLPAGQSGVVARIEEDDHAMLIRLKTMGMHEGRAVRVVRQGSRVIVSCGGTRVGLSAEVAEHVLVWPTTVAD